MSSSTCIATATTLCATVDPFVGENGYYRFAGLDSPLPELSVRIGQTYTFDQTDISNWWHPLGFAFYPDGANGETWGAPERQEVERADQLQYLINGIPASCPAHVQQPNSGDTGLDCYEPAFMDLRSEWRLQRFAVNLTVTPELAAASRGGAIYYFCHLHAKMSGRIRILNSDGSRYVPSAGGEGLARLDPPVEADDRDALCGTVGTSDFHPGGARACATPSFGGSIDTPFEQCLQAIDCQMRTMMFARTTADPAPTTAARIRTFMCDRGF